MLMVCLRACGIRFFALLWKFSRIRLPQHALLDNSTLQAQRPDVAARPGRSWGVACLSSVAPFKVAAAPIVASSALPRSDLEPEAWSDVRRGRASAFNLGERSEPERAEAEPNPRRTNSLPHGCFLSGQIVGQPRAEFRPEKPLRHREFESTPLRQRVFSSRDAAIAHRWAGPVGIPQGLVPLIGSLPRAPRILLASGYAGHGVALSIRMGGYLVHNIGEGKPFSPWGTVSD
jgi:hypothetical protein